MLGGLGLLLLLYFALTNEKSYNWNNNYIGTSDQPYGTLFIKKLLESRYGEESFFVHNRKSLSAFLKDEQHKNKTDFVFIGNELYLSIPDQEELLAFIERGNNAFIGVNVLPDLIHDIYEKECARAVELDYSFLSSATLNFYHPKLRDKYGYQYTYRNGPYDLNYNWPSFKETLFCDSTRNLIPLGFAEPGNVNFVKIPYEKGALFLHVNPIAFTNYFLVKKQKVQYAENVFAHLEGEKVIWDEYGKLPQFDKNSEDNNPLYFIMQQRSLKYAWWMMVSFILLYILFAAKRTQRVIPVLEEKINTSLEYIRMVSSLHYKAENHLGMAQKKMKYFQYFVRTKYGIHTHPVSDEVIAKISEKSEVPLNEVKAIFNLHKLIDQGSGSSIEPSRLTNFYYAIEHFYKNCK